VTFEEYKALPGINASSIKAGRISMKHMRYAMTGGLDESTIATRKGTLIHSIINSPDELMRNLAVFDGIRRGKVYDAFVAENAGKQIVKPAEVDALTALSKAVHADPDAKKLLAACTEREKVLRWKDPELGACKAMVDCYGPEVGIVEIKSTANITDAAFGKVFANGGYDIQCAWYQDGAKALCLRSDITMLVIESSGPFDVSVRTIPPIALKVGREKAKTTAKKYRECEACNVFPGVSNGVQELVMPSWYGEQEEIANLFADMAERQL